MKRFCKLLLCLFTLISLISCTNNSLKDIQGPLALRFKEDVYSHPLISFKYSIDDITIDSDLIVYHQDDTINGKKLEKFKLSKDNFDSLFDEPYTDSDKSYSGFQESYSIRSIKNDIQCSYKIEANDESKMYFLFTNDNSCYIAYIGGLVLGVQKSTVLNEKIEYKVTLANKNITLYISNEIAMEVCQKYELKINIPFYKMHSGIETKINFTYEENSFDICLNSVNSTSSYLSYLIAPTQVKQSTIKISFEQFEWIIAAKVADYDFASRNITPLTSFDKLDKYEEVQTLINSIEYYVFQEPFKGIEASDCYLNDGYGCFEIDFYHESSQSYVYNLDYLSYLSDSVYYPSDFPMILDNPIAYRGIEIYFDDENAIKEGASSSIIPMFVLGFSVIDPCCSGPLNPCHQLSFTAVAKNYNSSSEELKRRINNELNDIYYLLKDYYPNYYLQYNIGDIEVYILETSHGVEASFEDDKYLYKISSTYDF